MINLSTYKSIIKKSISAGLAISFAAITIFMTAQTKASATIIVPKVAIVYGDSISTESAGNIVGTFMLNSTWKTSQLRAFPGTAICDWLPELSSDIATYHPATVGLEVQGNALTPCMSDGNGGFLKPGTQAYIDKYRADFDTFFGTVTATGAKVVFAKTLPSSKSNDQTINNIALAEAAKFHGVSISKTPLNSVTLSGVFTWEKPCTTAEKTKLYCNPDGKITVRSPDGVHLCPGAFDSSFMCTVYSGGEKRYGPALARTVMNPPAPILP